MMYQYREFLVPGIFSFLWYRNRYQKNLVPEKVLELVLVKFGIGKKSQNRYQKNLVPEKVLEPVSVKFGIGKKHRNRYWEKFGTEKSTGIGIV